MPEMSKMPDKSRPGTGEERGEGKFPRGLVLRLFAYLVAGHLFAGFLYLLFMLGGQNQ